MKEIYNYQPPLNEGLDITYQDTDILTLSKPSGLLSVPGRSACHKDCLESRVQEHFPSARIVHRLDMDTSGIMVMALNEDAHRALGKQFENREVEKSYIAEVWGHPENDSGRIDLPLRCDWPNRPRQMVFCNVPISAKIAFSRTRLSASASFIPARARKISR